MAPALAVAGRLGQHDKVALRILALAYRSNSCQELSWAVATAVRESAPGRPRSPRALVFNIDDDSPAHNRIIEIVADLAGLLEIGQEPRSTPKRLRKHPWDCSALRPAHEA